MSLDENVRDRLDTLIREGNKLRITDEHGQARDDTHMTKCRGWLAAAHHVISLVVPQQDAPYQASARVILDASRSAGWVIPRCVGELTELLQHLKIDAEGGLIRSVDNQARGEVLDDLADHAEDALKGGRKDVSGVLSGVAFEDTLRRIAKSGGIGEEGLDQIITALEKSGLFTANRAKRCRAAAGLRTSAVHARWDEYELSDVAATIKTTRELIEEHLLA